MFFVSFTKTNFTRLTIGICYGYSLPEIHPVPCDKFLHTSSPMNQNSHDSPNDDLRHEMNKHSTLLILCEGNPPVADEFLQQSVTNAEIC